MVLASGERSFSIVHVVKSSGCETKHTDSRIISRRPADAAKKAFNRQCRLKRIRGTCSLTIVLKDTTVGTPLYGKQYIYKCKRIKLSKPIVRNPGGTDKEFVIKYKTTAHSVKSVPEGCKQSEKSRGPMFRSAKNRKMKGNK